NRRQFLQAAIAALASRGSIFGIAEVAARHRIDENVLKTATFFIEKTSGSNVRTIEHFSDLIEYTPGMRGFIIGGGWDFGRSDPITMNEGDDPKAVIDETLERLHRDASGLKEHADRLRRGDTVKNLSSILDSWEELLRKEVQHRQGLLKAKRHLSESFRKIGMQRNLGIEAYEAGIQALDIHKVNLGRLRKELAPSELASIMSDAMTIRAANLLDFAQKCGPVLTEWAHKISIDKAPENEGGAESQDAQPEPTVNDEPDFEEVDGVAEKGAESTSSLQTPPAIPGSEPENLPIKIAREVSEMIKDKSAKGKSPRAIVIKVMYQAMVSKYQVDASPYNGKLAYENAESAANEEIENFVRTAMAGKTVSEYRLRVLEYDPAKYVFEIYLTIPAAEYQRGINPRPLKERYVPCETIASAVDSQSGTRAQDAAEQVGDLGREERGTFAENAGSRQSLEIGHKSQVKASETLGVEHETSGKVSDAELITMPMEEKIKIIEQVMFEIDQDVRSERPEKYLTEEGDIQYVRTASAYGAEIIKSLAEK
ncbi:MAG: hypothetical protein WC419_04575, partial [Candidatus Omnitrophota bacterium]